MKEFNIAQDAVDALRALKQASPEAKPEHAIRVYMMMGFCGGPQWGFMLDDYHQDTDECCEFDGLKFVVERDILEAMGGLDITLSPSEEDGEDCFLVTPIDPDVQAFFEQQGHGCSGDCGHCHGCHGDCGNCGDDCDDDDCDCHHACHCHHHDD